MAADTVQVVIAYSLKKSDVGKLKELPVDEAKQLIREGRARKATDVDLAELGDPGDTAKDSQPTEADTSTASPDAVAAGSSETAASTSRPAAKATTRRS